MESVTPPQIVMCLQYTSSSHGKGAPLNNQSLFANLFYLFSARNLDLILHKDDTLAPTTSNKLPIQCGEGLWICVAIVFCGSLGCKEHFLTVKDRQMKGTKLPNHPPSGGRHNIPVLNLSMQLQAPFHSIIPQDGLHFSPLTWLYLFLHHPPE